MKLFPFLIAFICGLFITQNIYSQEVTLPYQEVSGIPIVQVTIDGKDYNFVFDTGADYSVIDSSLVQHLEVIDSIEITDIFNITKTLPVVTIPEIEIDSVKFTVPKAMVYDLTDISNHFCDIDVVGILGIDLMQGYIIEIDSKHQNIKFYNPKSFNKKQLKDYLKSKSYFRPFVKLKVNGQKYFATFDTGKGGWLDLPAKSKLLQYVKDRQIITYYNTGGYGLFGKQPQKRKFYKADTLNIRFGGWFDHDFFPSTPVSVSPDLVVGNFGFQYIKQFHVFLDQKRRKLYLKPYPQSDQDQYESSLLKYGFHLYFDFDSNQYYVNARTESNRQLEMGDIVLKIEGHSLPENKCDFENFKKEHYKDEMEITILRNNKEQVINYKYNYSI